MTQNYEVTQNKKIRKMLHDINVGNKFLQKISKPRVTKFKANKP